MEKQKLEVCQQNDDIKNEWITTSIKTQYKLQKHDTCNFINWHNFISIYNYKL